MLFTQLQASFSSKEMFIKKEVRWTLYTGSLNISIRSLNSVFYPKMEVVTRGPYPDLCCFKPVYPLEKGMRVGQR